MESQGFKILFEDGPCLVVCKPGGVLTQAPPNIDSLEVRIKRFLKKRDDKPGRVYLGVPHRLDRPVSGALVVARHARAARRLSEQFEFRTVEKRYWALVEGVPNDEQATWTDHLRKIPNQARAEVVKPDHPEGRHAVLSYRLLDHWPDRNVSLLEIRLETGRTHQIRVQCSFHHLPVLGDELYGATSSFGPDSTDERQRWIGLHARRLEFRHPMTRQVVSITAPLYPWWDDWFPDDGSREATGS